MKERIAAILKLTFNLIKKIFFGVAEWEAAKTSEPAKEAANQPVSAESPATSNTQTETYSHQVTMMPVQVQSNICKNLII